MKRRIISKIINIFKPEILVKLNEITYQAESNKVKGDMIANLLTEYKIERFLLGSGTNRLGVQIGDTVFKIALDKHGKTDNKREFKYTDKLQPYVIKVYECTFDGLVAACEPFIPMSQSDFIENKEGIIEILADISRNFFIGDIGYLPDKNYANWGFRKTDNSIGILDFAYIYSVNYNTFTCTCEGKPFLYYDDNYVKLLCPACGRKWEFKEIRKRIKREDEEKEIGNIMELSYNVKEYENTVEVNDSYTRSIYTDVREQELEKSKKMATKHRIREIMRKADERRNKSFNEFELDDPRTFDELIKSIKSRPDIKTI